jgi:hypothetical protein
MNIWVRAVHTYDPNQTAEHYLHNLAAACTGRRGPNCSRVERRGTNMSQLHTTCTDSETDSDTPTLLRPGLTHKRNRSSFFAHLYLDLYLHLYLCACAWRGDGSAVSRRN